MQTEQETSIQQCKENNPNIIRNLISNIESSTTSIKFMNTYTYRCTFE